MGCSLFTGHSQDHPQRQTSSYLPQSGVNEFTAILGLAHSAALVTILLPAYYGTDYSVVGCSSKIPEIRSKV